MPRWLPRWLWPSLLWDAIKDFGGVLWPARFSVGVLFVSIPFLLLPPSQDALLALVAGPNPASDVIFAAFSLLWALETYFWANFMSRLPAPARPPRPRGQDALLSPGFLECVNETLPRWLGLVALLIVGAATLKANRGNSSNCLYIAIVLGIDVALYAVLCWRPGGLLAARQAMRLMPVLRRVLQPPASAPAVHRDLFAAPEPGEAAPGGTRRRRARRAAPPPASRWKGRAAVAILAALTLIVLMAGGNHLGDGQRQLAAIGLAVAWLVMGAVHIVSLRRVDMDRQTKAWVLINLAIFVLIFAVSIQAAPVLIGRVPTAVTAPSVVLSAFAAWVFVGSFFIALPGERFRLPVLTIVVLLAVLWSALFADNHDVRLRPERHPPSLSLDEALKLWYPAGQQGPVPLVIIATAGGASRAGYWTAKILSEIEDAYPDFHKHVFAISSVSGGTLGAGLWRAMLEDGAPSCPAGSFAACARHYFCQDFLGPTMLTGLYADLAQRLLPGSVLPDRATALEQAWEAAWGKLMKKSPTNRMAAPFHDLMPRAGDWRPLMLINGTSEKSGRRIITSQLEIDAKSFPDAIDFFGAVASGVNLSTALHNSARFPYIDAAGNIRLPVAGQSAVVDRIVDGGYFENFGAATAFDLLQSLRQSSWAPRILPVVIQISSDPALLKPDKRDVEWRDRIGWWLDVASDTTVPPVTFYDTRDALGYRATENLERSLGFDWAKSGYAHFRLSDLRIPMSWAMSSFSIGAIDDEWAKTPDDQVARATVERLLWPGSPPMPAGSDRAGCSGLR